MSFDDDDFDLPPPPSGSGGGSGDTTTESKASGGSNPFLARAQAFGTQVTATPMMAVVKTYEAPSTSATAAGGDGDDDDDDLPPPPGAGGNSGSSSRQVKVKQSVASAASDSDDDLPAPPAKAGVSKEPEFKKRSPYGKKSASASTDSFESKLVLPTASKPYKSPSRAKKESKAVDDEDDALPPPPSAAGASKGLSVSKRSAASKIAAALQAGPPPQVETPSSPGAEEDDAARKARLVERMRKLNAAGSPQSAATAGKRTVTVDSTEYQVTGGNKTTAKLPKASPNPARAPPPSASPAAPEKPKFAGWASDGTALMEMPQGDEIPGPPPSKFCGVCGGPIQGGQVLEVGGVDYHVECFTCVACSQPLTGQILTVNDRFYHPGCVKCKVCSVSLQGGKFVLGKLDGLPYCVQHAASGAKTAGDRSKICQGCKTSILVTQRTISVNGMTWHQRCFVCGECRTNLEGKACSMMGNTPYCPKCHEKKFITKCNGCGEPCKGAVMEVPGESGSLSYHPRCFRCKTCSKHMKDIQFYVVKDQVYCWECANKVA